MTIPSKFKHINFTQIMSTEHIIRIIIATIVGFEFPPLLHSRGSKDLKCLLQAACMFKISIKT